jgi:hypothetical protein
MAKKDPPKASEGDSDDEKAVELKSSNGSASEGSSSDQPMRPPWIPTEKRT